MTAPRFNILTQKELVIDLSRLAMECIVSYCLDRGHTGSEPLECELDNFVNMLQNLLERSEPETGNLDLVGE
jgi:hypothetical protein